MTTKQSSEISKQIHYYEPNENLQNWIKRVNNAILLGIFWHDTEDEQINNFGISLELKEYTNAIKKVLAGKRVVIKKPDQKAEITIWLIEAGIHFEINMISGINDNTGHSMGFTCSDKDKLLDVEY